MGQIVMTNLTTDDAAEAFIRLVKGICHNKDDLKIERTVNSTFAKVSFMVHQADMPLLVGRGGRQARAIRFLAEEASRKTRFTIIVEILESYQGAAMPKRDFVAADLPANYCLQAVQDIADLVLGRRVAIECIDEPLDHRTRVEIDATPEEGGIVAAMCDAFWPFGYSQGRKIRVKLKNEPFASPIVYKSK